MSAIFICYRREDSQYQADRLHERLKPLVEQAGHEVFIDIDNIPLGVDFMNHIQDMIARCDVLLVLIGPNWLEVRDPVTSERRLDMPTDFVRHEIAAALKMNIRVIPLLMDGAQMPTPEQLPEDLRVLVNRNGLELKRTSFENDVSRLVQGLNLFPDAAETYSLVPIPAQTGSDATLPDSHRIAKYPAAISGALNTRQAAFIAAGGIALMLGGLVYKVVVAKTNENVQEVKESNSVSSIAAQIDESAWSTAQALGSVIAYHRYLEDPSNTAYRDQAEKALEDHALSIGALHKALSSKGFEPGSDNGLASIEMELAIQAFGEAIGSEIHDVELAGIKTRPIDLLARQISRWNGRAPSVAEGRLDVTPTFESVAMSVPVVESLTSGERIAPCEQCPELIVLEPNLFLMGDTTGQNASELPAREIQMTGLFAISSNEVSVAQYLACVEAGACQPPEWLEAGSRYNEQTGSDPSYRRLGDRLSAPLSPIIGVSWHDASSFANWVSELSNLSCRLPSEAEWEYAARAGSESIYAIGDKITESDANFSNSQNGPSSVGQYAPNAFGLFDMHGNVWEWTSDCYAEDYTHAQPVDGAPFVVEGCETYSVRGGSWYSSAHSIRSSVRQGYDGYLRSEYLGFRITCHAG